MANLNPQPKINAMKAVAADHGLGLEYWRPTKTWILIRGGETVQSLTSQELAEAREGRGGFPAWLKRRKLTAQKR